MEFLRSQGYIELVLPEIWMKLGANPLIDGYINAWFDVRVSRLSDSSSFSISIDHLSAWQPCLKGLKCVTRSIATPPPNSATLIEDVHVNNVL